MNPKLLTFAYVMTSDRNICYEHALSIQRDCFWRACTVAHNCHTKRSKQLQIAHSKLQIAHIKFKSPTANSNRSQQIKVAHSKFKLLTANYKLLTPLGVFGYLQPAVQLV